MAKKKVEEVPESGQSKEETGEVVIITTDQKPVKKKRMISTRDLPDWLENYHGVKEKSK